MWSKGAVIIKTYGDPSMANQMIEGANLKLVPVQTYDKMERDNYFLKKRSSASIEKKIRKARRKYGDIRKPGKIETFMLVKTAQVICNGPKVVNKVKTKVKNFFLIGAAMIICFADSIWRIVRHKE